MAGNGGRNKAFFNDKIRVTEKTVGTDIGYLTVARFPNRGFGSREGGRGNLRGKARNRHDFFAPVEIRKGLAPVLRLFPLPLPFSLCLSFSLFLHFVVLKAYMCVCVRVENIRISKYSNNPKCINEFHENFPLPYRISP